MDTPGKRKRNRVAEIRLIAIALLLALGAFVALVPLNFNKRPWQGALSGNSFSYLTQDEKGNYYAIDTGGLRVVSFTEAGQYRWDAMGSGTENMRLVIPAQDGGAYVAGYLLDSESLITEAAITQYAANGRRVRTVYTVEYPQGQRPLYNSGFIDIVREGDALHFLEKHADGLYRYRLNLNESAPKAELMGAYPYPDAEMRLLSAAFDSRTGSVYFIAKDGGIFRADESGRHEALAYVEAPKAPAFSLPYALLPREDGLYVSDIGTRTLIRIAQDGAEVVEDLSHGVSVDEAPMLYYWLAPAKDEGIVLTSRYDMLTRSAEGELHEVGTEFTYGALKRAQLMLWWLSVLILLLAALTIVGYLLTRAYRKMGAEKLMNQIILTVVIAVVTVLVMTQYSSSVDARFNTTTLDNLLGLSKLTAELIDGDGLMQINALEDFDGDAYRALRSQLSPASADQSTDIVFRGGDFFEEETNWDDGIYRMVLREIDGRACYIYSSSERWGAIYPMDYPFLGTEFEKIYAEDVQVSFPNITDYSGEFTYVLTPIHNSAGEITGVLEMGIDQRAFTEETNALLREIALSVIVVVLVVVLLIKEIVFLGQVFSKRVPRREKRLIHVDAIRPMVFLIFLLDCFALIISPLLAQSLYAESIGIPMEFAVAVAYSSTYLFLGLAALVGGRLSAKTGLYPLMIAGAVALLLGELLASYAANLWMLIAAKSIVGLGAGVLLNVADTFVALQPDQEDVTRGFSMTNVGMNSGTNCGIIIGTAIATAFGYHAAYRAAAVVAILLIAYVICMFRKDVVPEVRSEQPEAEVRGMSTLRFLFSKRVFAFFVFLVIPYLICNAFIYYFLPLTGSAEGLSEDNISRIVFAYGMVMIYIGPVLMGSLAGRFEMRHTLVVSALLIAAALILYSFAPMISVLMICVMVFALSDSFFFPGQNVYYAQLPEVKTYGPGAALGLSNIINGLAQTASSYVFALAMVFGVRQGVGLIGIGMAGCAVLFALMSRAKRGEIKP